MEKSHNVGRIVAIVAVLVTFALLIGASFSMQQSPSDKVWDAEMTVGSTEPRRLYIMYTDLACPYCDVFSRAALGHWDEFIGFLDQHHILFEIRLTDALYLGAGSTMSRDSAEAAYCAKREGKFWDYYHGALTALWDDYHSKGIGSSKTAQPITNLPDDYWLTIGHRAGLGADFDTCVTTHASADEVAEVTARAMPLVEGMPTFKFGSFSNSGFSDAWGWEYVKMYLEAGLK